MKTPMSELPKVSAAEIAAGVRKSREQIDLEAEHDELRRQRHELQEKIRQVSGELGKGGMEQPLIEKRASTLSAEKRSLDDQIYALRAKLTPIRQDRANRMREALEVVQAQAAKEVLDSATRMRAAIQTLGEISDEIARAGGGLDYNRPSMPNIGGLEAQARHLLQPRPSLRKVDD